MIRKLLHFLWLLILIVPTVKAQTNTYTAATCNQSDVSAVINGPTHVAVDGDTIKIPSGSCTWTGTIATINGIGITIQGAGTPNTLASQVGAATASTIITDNRPNAQSSGDGSFFIFNPNQGNHTSRVSMLSFTPTDTSGTTKYGFLLQFVGNCSSTGCPNIRLDNITLAGSYGNTTFRDGFFLQDDTFGVADHNTIGDSSHTGWIFFNVNHHAWQGVGCCGDNSWAQPDTYGTVQSFFLENNILNNFSGTDTGFNPGGGSRIVCRFNTWNITQNGFGIQEGCGNHGTETCGRNCRSARQMEVYYNTFNISNDTFVFVFTQFRGSTARYFGNTINIASGSGLSYEAAIQAQRTFRSTSAKQVYNFGMCDGASPWDTNDGITYYQGTIGSASPINGGTFPTTDFTVTDSDSPGWTVGQWNTSLAGAYSFYDVTGDVSSEGAPGPWGTEIGFNGSSNTITTDWNSQAGRDTPHAGDTYQILRATVCLDQPARGQGLLLTNNAAGDPILASTGNPGPVNEALDPIYLINEKINGTLGGNCPNNAYLTYSGGGCGTNGKWLWNRDIYAATNGQTAQTSTTSPFNGSAPTVGSASSMGVGWGTLANRPATCGGSVAYLATDQGSWNANGNGQGVWFICSGGAWPSSPSYIPAAYPHPLISGTSTPAPVDSFLCNGSGCASGLNFGSQTVGTTSTSQTVTLTNTGNATNANIGFAITGANTGSYSQINNCPSALAASQSCTITVVFAPQAAGTLTASLTVTDTVYPSGAAVVAFTGRGTVPGLWTNVGTAVPQHTSAATTCTVTLSPVPTAGLTIFTQATIDSSSTPTSITVTDGASHSFTFTPSSPYGNTTFAGFSAEAYILSAPSGFTNPITWTVSPTPTSGISCWADSFSLATGYTAAFVGDATSNASGTTVSAPSLTPAGAHDLFFAVEDVSGHVTAISSPWYTDPNQVLNANGATTPVPSSGNAAEFFFDTASATSVGFTTTSTGQNAILLADIKAVAAGSTPTISSLSVTSGLIGSSFNITGTNFSTTLANNAIVLNTTAVSCGSSTSTTITGCTVPAGATTGCVTVTVAGSVSNCVNYTVLPNLTGISPASGPVGTSVTLTGTAFGATQGSSVVSFNGTNGISYANWTSTSVTVLVPAGATTGPVTITVAGNVSASFTFTVIPAIPMLTGLTPAAGPVSTQVTITGTSFATSCAGDTVAFNGTVATPTACTTTSITTPVPTGATTGSVTVTTSSGTSNGVLFTVTVLPVIQNLSPPSGTIGSLITIVGGGFGNSQGTSTVSFNGTTATSCPTWTNASVACLAPTGATTGNVTVTTSVGTSNGVVFTVTTTAPPTLTSVTPNAGPVGTGVVIQGTNLGTTVPSVTFNGTAAVCGLNGTAGSDTPPNPNGSGMPYLTCTVPTGTATGNIVATGPGGASNGILFTVVASGPTITGLTPNAATVGSGIVFTGTGFSATCASNTVVFNGVTAATPTNCSTTSLYAIVPNTATTGNATVTVASVTSNGVPFTVTPSNPPPTAPVITSATYTITVNLSTQALIYTLTINGSNFGASQSTSTATFNGANITVTTWGASQIVGTVAGPANSAGVVVTVGGTPSNSAQLTIPVVQLIIQGVTTQGVTSQ